MKRKFFRAVVGFVFSLSLAGDAFSEWVLPTGALAPRKEMNSADGIQSLGIMRPDMDTLRKWMKDYEEAPQASIDEKIDLKLKGIRALGYGTSLSLLNYLDYVPSERNQGSCGNCWVWASTGVMEIAHSVRNGIKNRLSIQFLNSCKTDEYACCGGNLTMFSNWYGSTGGAIPWSNTNASYQDGYSQCGDGSSPRLCSDISISPYYPVSEISPATISTKGIGESQAISNIKNILNQNKAVWLGFWLPNASAWDTFYDGWRNDGETAIWIPDAYCGETYIVGEGGGHAVLVVGYDDDDPDPGKHYWIVLNSWGTASGSRPHGLFRLKMYINYDCSYPSGPWAFQWQTLNIKMPTPRLTYYTVDFDGDEATDVAAFHLPSDHFLTGSSGNLGQYGWEDSMPILWDHNGDGETEVSIYHIPTNQWFVKGVPGDNLGQFGWGGEESIPVPGDYNGDRLMDRAFYHWPTNRWFVEGQEPAQFGWGAADCIPIAADYDGDGTTDRMLYHVPTNQWFVYGVGNLGQFGWNGSESIPVPGDWDGDGKTEIGIYHRPSNQWLWRDEDGTAHFLGQYGWGGSESFPIPGDYDGNGVMERAFYRPAQNGWFIEGEADFNWGWDGGNFIPITSQTAIHNWFRFVLGWFQ